MTRCGAKKKRARAITAAGKGIVATCGGAKGRRRVAGSLRTFPSHMTALGCLNNNLLLAPEIPAPSILFFSCSSTIRVATQPLQVPKLTPTTRIYNIVTVQTSIFDRLFLEVHPLSPKNYPAARWEARQQQTAVNLARVVITKDRLAPSSIPVR